MTSASVLSTMGYTPVFCLHEDIKMKFVLQGGVL
nr:MAG TPA: hypothetical protein [Caudoviricetes sp.]DAS79505.1 MAG TPA: hypothetical protein [Caudoviricetes sp.]DAX30991.1 MAG TPA: hypothetical protein [Caudoviricetes sp.]DAX43603.1 MAG TPA: hypothetical protein [Caudoviricetes sp.]